MPKTHRVVNHVGETYGIDICGSSLAHANLGRLTCEGIFPTWIFGER